jgi:hypothetical protein
MSSKKKSDVKSKKLNQTDEIKETPTNNTDVQIVLDNDNVNNENVTNENPKRIIKKNLKQTGGGAKQKKSVVESKVETKTKEKKKEKQKISKKKEVSGDNGDNGHNESNEELTEKRIRSFKVKLPNKEDYEGRFTGLTPYQAANKALSKHFRENPDSLEQITFSISESTRNSKKTNYTYVGKREKLQVPVVYKIQDGREIVKNFKNSLKKVKKAELNLLN